MRRPTYRAFLYIATHIWWCVRITRWDSVNHTTNDFYEGSGSGWTAKLFACTKNCEKKDCFILEHYQPFVPKTVLQKVMHLPSTCFTVGPIRAIPKLILLGHFNRWWDYLDFAQHAHQDPNKTTPSLLGYHSNWVYRVSERVVLTCSVAEITRHMLALFFESPVIS